MCGRQCLPAAGNLKSLFLIAVVSNEILILVSEFNSRELYSHRPKAEQPAEPEESTNTEGEGNGDKHLAAPDDIFTAKKRLGKRIMPWNSVQ